MEFKVRVFLDGKRIEPSEISNLVITNPAIDRIVNDIVDNQINQKGE